MPTAKSKNNNTPNTIPYVLIGIVGLVKVNFLIKYMVIIEREQLNSIIINITFDSRNKAKMDVSLILNETPPELIDEWGEVPEIWDAVRHNCDKDGQKGKYILTESTTLRKKEDEEKI